MSNTKIIDIDYDTSISNRGFCCKNNDPDIYTSLYDFVQCWDNYTSFRIVRLLKNDKAI